MRLPRVLLYVVLLTLCSSLNPLGAQSWLSAGWGEGSNGIQRLRLASSHDLQPPWWPEWLPRPALTLQPGLSYWQYPGGHTWSVSLLPEIGWQRPLGSEWQLAMGAGIGISAFSDAKVKERHLGTAFQFEDRVGIGLLHAPMAIWLRAYHYSNGNLTPHNAGINLISLELGWQLP